MTAAKGPKTPEELVDEFMAHRPPSAWLKDAIRARDAEVRADERATWTRNIEERIVADRADERAKVEAQIPGLIAEARADERAAWTRTIDALSRKEERAKVAREAGDLVQGEAYIRDDYDPGKWELNELSRKLYALAERPATVSSLANPPDAAEGDELACGCTNEVFCSIHWAEFNGATPPGPPAWIKDGVRVRYKGIDYTIVGAPHRYSTIVGWLVVGHPEAGPAKFLPCADLVPLEDGE